MKEAADYCCWLPSEQEAIRAKCFHPSGIFDSFPNEDVEGSIPARFEKMVSQHGKRLAVKLRNESVTYNELNSLANRVAHAVLEHSVDPKRPVVLMSEDGSLSIAACLGVMKAGAVLLVVDPSLPISRLRYIASDSFAGAIVSDSKNYLIGEQMALSDSPIINIQTLNSVYSDLNPGVVLGPDSLAQVVYTSGSTGQSKGIIIPHRRILHDVRVFVNSVHISPEDRITQLRKLTFGAGIKDLFRTLLSGAAIFPYSLQHDGMSKLSDFLKDERITIFSPGVSAFRHFVKHSGYSQKRSNIRLVMLGGDSISPEDVKSYKDHFPFESVLLHHLSSTEAGLMCQYFIAAASPGELLAVPVGYAVDGKEIILTDDNGRLVNAGDPGEIIVKSRYLSAGYWRNEELTDATFRRASPNAVDSMVATGDLGWMQPDGCLFHLGRKDLLVRIRNYRVDIGEIERTLLQCGDVEEAAVAAWARSPGDKYLTAYIVRRPQSTMSVADVRTFLKSRLPDYMSPSRYVEMKSLPRINGKLQRGALPRPDRRRPDLDIGFGEARSDVEVKISAVWRELLGFDEIGVHDNFCDLGGDSLCAMRIVSELSKRFQMEIPLRLLFQSPTIAEMAVAVAVGQRRMLGDDEIRRTLEEIESTTDEEARRELCQSKIGT